MSFPRDLDGSANKLLALYSLFEMVHQSGHFLFVYTVFSGHYLIEFPIAVRILSPSYFAFGCTTLLLFFTSIDRLLYVLFPLRTAQYENAIICCVVLPIAGLFGAFYVCSLYLNSGSLDDQLIIGTLTDLGTIAFIQSKNLVQLLYEIVTIILLATIVIYALIAILLHFKKEVADARVINPNPGNAYAKLKAKLGYSDKLLEQHIANEFNKNILGHEKPLPPAVVDQLLMLSISFAVRLFVSFKFHYYVFDKDRESFDKWQIETLLSAYKILSTKSGTNWICPFKIIQCHEHTAEHDQYIQNFKFVLKLSDFSLTSFEVYKLSEIILIEAERIMDDKSNNNVQAFEQQPLALYTFVKQYFVEIIGKKTTPVPKSMEKLVHCALLSFGRELLFRVSLTYKEFRNYFFAKRENECKDVYSTEILDSFMLAFFNEPLRNYPSVIQINVDQCKGVRQFAETLPFKKYSDKVKYDENVQLMSLPPKLAEHFLERLFTLTESKSASICEIGTELDFVQTMQNVASTEQFEKVTAGRSPRKLPCYAYAQQHANNILRNVEDLLEEMASGNKIPKFESIEIAIGHFILVKEELCKEKSIEKNLRKYFGENLVNFGKAINIDFSPHNELHQIGREIIKKIEQMLQNGDDWNYAYLNNSKMDEWNLLEYDLRKSGNNQKWEEIEQLRDEWKNSYNKWVYNKFAEERPSWILVVFASIYTFVATVGIVMNFLVFFVTIRTKFDPIKPASPSSDARESRSQLENWALVLSLGDKTGSRVRASVLIQIVPFPRDLDGSANKLLALYSLFEMVHQFGHFLFVYTVFSGHYLIKFPIAVRILSPSFFAFGCTTLLLFFTSIDRLLYVLFPLRTAQYDNAIICCVVLPIAGMFGAFYVAPSNSNSNQLNMRIFRSLFIIVSMNISGYFVFDFFIAISKIMPMPNLASRQCQHILSHPLHSLQVADARVINPNLGNAYAKLKAKLGYSDKLLEQHIANEFNKNILGHEKPLPPAVVDQLLMLSISFAVRLFVSFKFHYYVFDKDRESFDKWQIETLLSAYKILSTKSGTNWICPFKIIQCHEHTAEHDQYIQNFKFVLKLSDFSLTSFEVYKLSEIILIEAERIIDDKSNNNVQAFEQQPLALYTFVKQYFVENIGKKTTPVPKSMEKLVHCALLSFGRELLFRVSLTYKEFRNYFFAKREDECKDVYSTEILDSFMLAFFNEPLRNYPSVIQINVDQCKGVRQFAETLPFKKYSDKVKYDENVQIMSLPPKLAEHFLERLFTLTESKSASICEIGTELDFVQTMQNFPDYLQKENIEKLRQEEVQENFLVMHMPNSTPTTFYEMLKEFCVLAHFIEDLLEEMASGNKIPKFESIEIAIGHFILVKEELCKEKSIEKDLKKYFGENLVNFGKAINIDFSPHNELHQIGREIIKKIEQMLQNDDWNYAYLNNSKMDEWNLLEYDLRKMGNDQKWEEIEQFRNEWKKAYNKWVYNKFAEERPSWILVVFASIYTFVATVGIVMNFLVFFVTIRTKFDPIKPASPSSDARESRDLDGSANKLLALYSLFEMVHQSGHFLFVYTVFSGHYLIKFPIAVRILSPSFFAFGCTTLLLFFTSIDRLLYVLFPLRTAQYDNAIICCVVLPIAGMFGAFYVGSLYLNAGSLNDKLIIGTLSDVGSFVSIQCDNWMQSIFFEIVTILLLATIVIYALIAILLYSNKAPSNTNSNQLNMRIFRSLFIIVSVNISGYFVFDFFIAIILPYFVLLPMAYWKWNQIIGIVLNVSAASNAPILYLTSSEYRKAFRKELKPFINIFSRNSCPFQGDGIGIRAGDARLTTQSSELGLLPDPSKEESALLVGIEQYTGVFSSGMNTSVRNPQIYPDMDGYGYKIFGTVADTDR
uniref:G-protein coupled receptors family 1 profile domain-containing protein n=1 Tax=Globodera rostochiensis TaxID=31243 RepID=A0A914HLS5_GLORO